MCKGLAFLYARNVRQQENVMQRDHLNQCSSTHTRSVSQAVRHENKPPATEALLINLRPRIYTGCNIKRDTYAYVNIM